MKKQKILPNIFIAGTVVILTLLIFCAISAKLWEKQILTDETAIFAAEGSMMLAVLSGCLFLKKAEKENWIKLALCLTTSAIVLCVVLHFCIGGKLAAGWYRNLAACLLGFGLSVCGKQHRKQKYRHKARQKK